MDEITPRLYISDIQSVAEEPTGQFDYVLSVCQDTVEDNVSAEYEHIPLADSRENAERWGGHFDMDWFSRAVDAVVEQLRFNRTVLVHCHNGQNRSAAVCIAALAIVENLPYSDAFDAVAHARPIINPTDTLESWANYCIECRSPNL